MFSLLFLTPIILLICSINSYTQTIPINNYTRAGTITIINSLQSSNLNEVFPVVYSQSFTQIPKMIFGIKSYSGYDWIKSQKFQLFPLNQTMTGFQIKLITWQNQTYLLKLQISYFAIDKQFPFRLNIFNNINLNYSQPLSNGMTTYSRVNYTGIFNYSKIAQNTSYNKFFLPLADHRIDLFISTLAINCNGNGTWIDLTIYGINTTHFGVRIGKNIAIMVQAIRFNFIMLDIGSISRSNIYSAIFINRGLGYSYKFDTFMIPAYVKQSFMLGLTIISGLDDTTSINFQWYYTYTDQSNTRLKGVNLLLNTPYNQSLALLHTYRMRGFYFLSKICPQTHIFYNSSQKMCQDQCDDYYFSNLTDKLCYKCHYSCFRCENSLSVNQVKLSSSCSQCLINDYRILVNQSYCKCINGMFDNRYEAKCRNCTQIDPNSMTCNFQVYTNTTTSYYQSLFQSSQYPNNILQTEHYKSLTCISGYFVNISTYLCSPCNIQNCLSCQNPQKCLVCSNNTLLSIFVQKCYSCMSIQNCISCSMNQICQKCQEGYKMGDNMCRMLECNQSCKCEGYYFNGSNLGVNVNSNQIQNKCMTICGDNIKVKEEQCDDGNTIHHDSCSNLCQINHYIINSSNTEIPSIFLYFLFGFKLIGIEMLLVLQNFQMILQVQKIQLIQMNFNLHGLSYLQNFPFSDILFFQHFNIMSLCIFVLSLIWISWQIVKYVYNYIKYKNNNKISNIQNQINPTINLQFPSSQLLKIQSQIKNQNNVSNNININNNSNIIYTLILFVCSHISLPQIIFDLIINSLLIFTFSLTKSIKIINYQQQQHSIFNNIVLNIPTLITISFYFLLLIILFIYIILQNNNKFGQNQTKLNSKLNLILYWLIAIIQRIIFSGLIAIQSEYYLYVILGIKLILIIFMLFKNLFVQKIQFIRNLIIQILHFLLIATIIVNKQVIQNVDANYIESNITNITKYFWEYISISIIICVVLVSAGFIIKQIVGNLKFKNNQSIHNNQNQAKNIQQLKTQTIKVAQITEFNSETILNG